MTPPCPAPARPVAHAPLTRPSPRVPLAGHFAERSFVATDGRHWRVREHVVRAPGGEPHRRLLVFECRQVLRWLRDFPFDWHRRTDAELERLSWRV